MTIDKGEFAKECVRQGLIFGANPHYILGVAQLRSGISDGAVGAEVGPFRLTQAEWNAHCADNAFGFTFLPTDITDPVMQIPVFAATARRALDAFEAANNRTPSVKELYLQQFPNAPTANLSADLKAALDATAYLIEKAAVAVLDDDQTPPPTITSPEQPVLGRAVGPSDSHFVPDLVRLASDAYQLVAAQHLAAQRLLDFDGEIFPFDGSAITLSVLLQESGIRIPDTFQAIALGNLLKSQRNWQVIPLDNSKKVILAPHVELSLITVQIIFMWS